jgi:hypothetical protein
MSVSCVILNPLEKRSDYVRFRPGSRLLALDDDEAAPHPPEAKVYHYVQHV